MERPPTGTIPDAPGSYQFKDRDGRVIYVGKAKSLRSRLSNYFAKVSSLPARTAQMVTTADPADRDRWPEYRSWAFDRLGEFRDAVQPIIDRLPSTAQ